MRKEKHDDKSLLVGREEAAAMLGISVDLFDEYVRPRLPVIPVGRRLLFSVKRLAEWVEQSEVRIY